MINSHLEGDYHKVDLMELMVGLTHWLRVNYPTIVSLASIHS